MEENNTKISFGTKLRKWLRAAHRELSYVFAGMVLVYAISGIAFNHKSTFNSQYSIVKSEHQLTPVCKEEIDANQVAKWLQECEYKGKEIQHYFPDSATVKIFLKGNSSLVVDIASGNAVLEQVKKRPILGSLSRLHYNPGKAWTIFSDTFCIAMIILVLTGIFMLKGKHSLKGIGGIEFLIGILIPLLFILL